MFRTRFFALVTLLALDQMSFAQAPKEIVEQAVQTELAANRNDHSHWLYFEIDRQPGKVVKQWVAQARSVNLDRVIERNGQTLPENEQRQEMNAFLNNPGVQAKQRKSGQHDDEQSAELLQMLPNAFIWTVAGEKGSDIQLHFSPDPKFHPPNLEARVFAAMEGDLALDREQHRIASLRGRLIHDVKIAYGLLGNLEAGGTFDVERRELRPRVWQITETHVHIRGHALIFRNISEQEDDVKMHFEQIADSTSLQQAQAELLHHSNDPTRDQALHRSN